MTDNERVEATLEDDDLQDDVYMRRLRGASLRSIDAIEALLTYQGRDRGYLEKAKIACVTISAYKGMKQAENGRRLLERQFGADPLRLGVGKKR
jgi:hypothetical protein